MKDSTLPLVFVMGDSISVQYGPHLKNCLQGFYRYDRLTGDSEALRDLDVPQGANGGDSNRVAVLLQALLGRPEFHPDVLLLNCGLHDIKRDGTTREIQVPLDDYRSNLEEIIARCSEAGVALAWVRTTPVVDAVHNQGRGETRFHRFATDLEVYNRCADEVMKAGRIPVLDLHTFTRGLGEDAELFCDHVHFKEEIREKQGAFLAGCLAGRLAFHSS